MQATIRTVFLVFLLMGNLAHAGVITQSQSFDILAPLMPGDLGIINPMLLDPFDPALGSLTQVDVSIDGLVNVSAVLPDTLRCANNGCFHQPYFFDLNVVQDYGLGFLLNPEIRYTGVIGGLPGVLSSITPYSYSMSFTEMTDSIGIASVASSATPTPPIQNVGVAVVPATGASRQREDFSNAFGIPLVFLRPMLSYTLAGGVSIGGPVTGSIRSRGTISTTYFFDDASIPLPLPEPGTLPLPLPLPEPDTLLLLGIGIAGLGFAGKYAGKNRRSALPSV